MKLSLIGATLGLTIAACASDEVLGFEDTPDASTASLPDAGSPSADASVARCGNGTVEPGEACDDGNTKDGDGCNAKCAAEAPSACPGTAIALTASGDLRKGAVTADTSTGALTMASNTCGGGNGKDLVYTFTSPVAGRAVVRLDAKFDALLAVRKSCAEPATETGCKAVPVGGGKTEIALPVAPNETATVVVDGVAGKSGAFTLEVEISPAFCGDGLATYPEQCDDGNSADGDGCSAACKLEGADPGVGKCPGIGVPFTGDPNAPKTLSVAGDVTLLANTMGTFGCGGIAGGKDQAYAVTPSISGALTAVLHAQWPEAALHARRECFSSATEVDCRMAPAGPVRLTVPVTAGETTTLFVDSKSSASFATGGLYTLELTLAPATCGNGVLETPETCDDGNATAGDGCSATCTLEPTPPELDSCPGFTIPFAGDPAAGPLTYRTTASTATLEAKVRTVEESTSTPRKDAAYTFIAPFDGYLTAKAKGGFNLTLDFRTNCLAQAVTTGVSTGSIDAADEDGGDGEETVRGIVTAGTTYHLIVDGPSPNTNVEGPFTLDVLLEKAVCGNGRIEGGEACDDGNLANGDTCDATCVIEPLGTPSRDTCATAEDLVLAEDPAAAGTYRLQVKGGNWNLTSAGSFAAPCGATTGRDAFFRVVPPIDGVLVADVDATYNVTPGVRTACPPSTGTAFLTCSNKTSGPGGERLAFPVVSGTPYWIIVDAANATTDRGAFTMNLTLKSEDCGDGVAGGVEECDDGNKTNGDGCSSACKLEPLAGVDTCPGHTVQLAGVGNAIRTKSVTLSTATLGADYSGTCGGSSRDGVLKVVSDVNGTMNAQLEASWATVFYARESCADGSTQLSSQCKAFDAAQPARTLRDLSFPVIAGIPTYLFVDGLSGASGPGTVYLTVTP